MSSVVRLYLHAIPLPICQLRTAFLLSLPFSILPLDIYIRLQVLAVYSLMRLKSMSARKCLCYFALFPIDQVAIPY
jgi:hypothetical protein